MSAVTPIADKRRRNWIVRLVPLATSNAWFEMKEAAIEAAYFLRGSYSLFSSRESSARNSDKARLPENSAACLDWKPFLKTLIPIG
jgi:hypothetical protein